MLNSLRADVDALTGDLQAANGKLRSIMSLLSDVAGGQNQAFLNRTSRGSVGGGGGGGSGFQGGHVTGSVAPPAEVVHEGSVAFWGRIDGGRKVNGGINGGGQDWGVGGAPSGYLMGPCDPMGYEKQGLGQCAFYPPPSQNSPSTPPYPVGPHQVGGYGHVDRYRIARKKMLLRIQWSSLVMTERVNLT